jgi:hypothetical protein
LISFNIDGDILSTNPLTNFAGAICNCGAGKMLAAVGKTV